MKRHLLSAALVLFATASVFAQSEKTTVIIKKNDSNEKITIVERIFQSKLKQTLPDLYYGYLDVLDGAFGPKSDVPLRSSSFEWGTYNQHTVFMTNDGHFGMSWGFGISNSYNYFHRDEVMRLDDDHETYFQPLNVYSAEDGNGPINNIAHRSFLRYWSFRLPLMLQVQGSLNDHKMAFAAGAELECRVGVRSFARYGGKKHLVTDGVNYKPVGVNALFAFSSDNSVFFVRVGLTDMFTSPNHDDFYQMCMGFGFNFD